MTGTHETYQVPVYAVELVADRLMDGPVIRGPEGVARLAAKYLAKADREHFVVIMLAANSKVIGLHTAHIGSLRASIVRCADVFKAILLANAASAIVAHNHPSGNLEPSAEDIAITKVLVEAGRILNVPILDHVIVGQDGGFTSLARRGIIS